VDQIHEMVSVSSIKGRRASFGMPFLLHNGGVRSGGNIQL
jgi:hypothetical protein